jgi:hypothetical protein
MFLKATALFQRDYGVIVKAEKEASIKQEEAVA